jgi:hypothetical protein
LFCHLIDLLLFSLIVVCLLVKSFLADIRIVVGFAANMMQRAYS